MNADKIVQCMICEKRFATIIECAAHQRKMSGVLAGKNKAERAHLVHNISELVMQYDETDKSFNATEKFINAVADMLAGARETRKEGWNERAKQIVLHLRSAANWSSNKTIPAYSTFAKHARWYVVQEMVYLNYKV